MNGLGAANFNLVGLCVGGGSGKKIGFMVGLMISDVSGGTFWVWSGFVGVMGLVLGLSISIVLIFRGLFVWSWGSSFFFNRF